MTGTVGSVILYLFSPKPLLWLNWTWPLATNGAGLIMERASEHVAIHLALLANQVWDKGPDAIIKDKSLIIFPYGVPRVQSLLVCHFIWAFAAYIGIADQETLCHAVSFIFLIYRGWRWRRNNPSLSLLGSINTFLSAFYVIELRRTFLKKGAISTLGRLIRWLVLYSYIVVLEFEW